MNLRLENKFTLASASDGSASRSHSFAELLPVVLSVTAGSSDVTSLLALGLFSAHVTGNLVILTAQIVALKADAGCLVLSVPIFIMVLCLTRLLVACLEAFHIRSLRPLLLLQFLMLCSALSFVSLSTTRIRWRKAKWLPAN